MLRNLRIHLSAEHSSAHLKSELSRRLRQEDPKFRLSQGNLATDLARLDLKIKRATSLSCCRGHGTYMGEEKLIASVAGSVERVNKLICVKALKTR